VAQTTIFNARDSPVTPGLRPVIVLVYKDSEWRSVGPGKHCSAVPAANSSGKVEIDGDALVLMGLPRRAAG
jgi:hypothetical protein